LNGGKDEEKRGHQLGEEYWLVKLVEEMRGGQLFYTCFIAEVEK